jgi:hypothetical protein
MIDLLRDLGKPRMKFIETLGQIEDGIGISWSVPVTLICFPFFRLKT